MSNQDFLNQATVNKSSVTSYTVKGSSDAIEVTVIGDHLCYTGGYGNAVLRMSGCKGVLNVIGAHSNNEYILSKVITSDMDNSEARQSLMCDTLRHLAANL